MPSFAARRSGRCSSVARRSHARSSVDIGVDTGCDVDVGLITHKHYHVMPRFWVNASAATSHHPAVNTD
ncbi:MAG: hypothetical protein LUO89_05910 [Methanothrix sp.]|nr:hypothetical protein [Methanothrix sp.]